METVAVALLVLVALIIAAAASYTAYRLVRQDR